MVAGTGLELEKAIPEYAGTGGFVPITKQMLLSQAWRKMTANQQRLYVFGRFRCFDADHPRKDFPDLPMMQKNDVFYLSFPEAVKMGFYTKGNKKRFYEDMHQIEKLGFWKKITLVPNTSNGGEYFPRAVYKMTADWMDYKGSECR